MYNHEGESRFKENSLWDLYMNLYSCLQEQLRRRESKVHAMQLELESREKRMWEKIASGKHAFLHCFPQSRICKYYIQPHLPPCPVLDESELDSFEEKPNTKTGKQQEALHHHNAPYHALFLPPRDQLPSTGEEEVEEGIDNKNVTN